MSPKPTISACLVVYNEEAIIERCLKSLAGFVDEIIMVHDGECADGTLQIAKKYHAKTYTQPHIGIAEPHRVFALEKASGDWILWIDADEYPSEELKQAIVAVLPTTEAAGIRCIWPLWDGKKAVTTNWPYREILFKKSSIHYLGFPQEPFHTSGTLVDLPYVMHHTPAYNNYTLKRFITKWRSWAKIQAEWSFKPLAEIPQFQWESTDWPANYKRAFKYSYLFVLLGAYSSLLSLKSGSWKEGRLGIKQSLMWGGYIAMTYYYVTVLKFKKSHAFSR